MASSLKGSIALLLSLGLVPALVLTAPATALPYHAHGATVATPDTLVERYDFVVVGAGTAGLTVADRLSEDGQHTVLVVDYGYLDTGLSITTTGSPFGFLGPPTPNGTVAAALASEPYSGATRFYNLTSEAMPGLGGRQQSMYAGCIVGGSSAVNGMVFGRGSAEDYDAWVWAAGGYDTKRQREYGAEWGWDNLLPFFQKSTTFHEPPPEMVEQFGMTSDAQAAYGGNTPIHSSYSPFQWPTMKIIWDAFKYIPGVEFPKEGAAGNATGVFWAPNSIDPATRTRSYSLLGHYSNPGGASTRKNFHILPAHRVTQVILSRSTNGSSTAPHYSRPSSGDEDTSIWEAQGVIITPRDGNMTDGPIRVAAKREVVLSAGAVHTPQVLQRSGIGPRDTLEKAGVQVKVELPGVGYNLQDHYTYSMTFNYSKSTYPDLATVTNNATLSTAAQVLWDTNRTGPYAYEVNSFAYLPLSVISNRTDEIVAAVLAQDPSAYLPNNTHPAVVAGYAAQLRARARQFLSRRSAVLEIPFSGSGSSLAICHMKGLSRGTVLLAPDDDGVTPSGRGNREPLVTWRAFSNPLDVTLNVEEMKFTRQLMASEGMQSLGPEEISPGPAVATDDEMAEYLRQHISPSNGHMVGTAALGPRELGGVVGPDLQVHGVRRLSIADNSIITLTPATHTSSTAYAIGEKAAELTLKRVKAASGS